MNRDYSTGSADDAIYFIGNEVERTPAFGLKTLFITGKQPLEEIKGIANVNKIKHLFFGSNHSFKPETSEDWDWWESMIKDCLDEGYYCSLDIPIALAEEFLESGLTEYENFIPQLRVPIPYIKLWNYNTMLKIDDKDFKATNPGVWCHSLHDLMDRKKFTDWSNYASDEIIELTTIENGTIVNE